MSGTNCVLVLLLGSYYFTASVAMKLIVARQLQKIWFPKKMNPGKEPSNDAQKEIPENEEPCTQACMLLVWCLITAMFSFG